MSLPFLHAWDPLRYQPAYLRFGPLEAAVQRNVVAVLRTRYRARVTVIDTGDARFRGRAAGLIRQAGGDPRRLIGRGGAMEPGIVDLAVTFPGGLAGWIEVKRPARYALSPKTGRLIIDAPAGEPTAEQLAYLDDQHRFGAIVGVAWSADDLATIVPAQLARCA